MNTKTLYLIIAILTVAVVFLLNKSMQNKNESPKAAGATVPQVGQEQVAGECYMWTSLTVSESKRLIAKGLMRYAPVAENLREGELIVTKGSTNHYFYEELMGRTIEKGSFLLGNIQPKGRKFEPQIEAFNDELYLKNGAQQHLSLPKALEQMQEGALVFKGANLINYARKQATVLVGHPTGGTAGKILPYIQKGIAKLIIPVGLEKNTSEDLEKLAEKFKEKRKDALRIISLPGELFTEIEAIQQFAKVEILQIAAGGLNGAEGAVTLNIRGTEEEVAKVQALLSDIQGEKAFY